MPTPPSPSVLHTWTQTQPPHRQHLFTHSKIASFTLGTGATIISNTSTWLLNLPHLPQELIIVTCFWAPPPSLDSLIYLLTTLSARAIAQQKVVHVRISVSSISLWQKLTHTWSTRGKTYTPKQWRRRLYLPFDSPADLPGLDLKIKSVFIPPASVMHSKFILVDRQVCLLPSCNVSWEEWLEGCVELRGPVVGGFCGYWEGFWGRGGGGEPDFSLQHTSSAAAHRRESVPSYGTVLPASQRSWRPGSLTLPRTDIFSSTSQKTYDDNPDPTPTLLLPSPHHSNPRPFQSPPSTPLNDFTLHLLSTAEKSIYIRTPNLTCSAVIDALLEATGRGVDVRVITNRNLMVLEQWVTAWTTTSRCVASLQKRYDKLVRAHERQWRGSGDVEATATGTVNVGTLRIVYYDDWASTLQDGVPKKAHIKCLIVDERVVLLGSGNMDRASWVTSQEVGVAVECERFAREVRGLVGAFGGDADRVRDGDVD